MTRVEPLEARIAPATILPGNKQLIYTDIDGDSVTVTFSKEIPNPPSGLIVFNTPFADSSPQQLQLLDLSEGPIGDYDIKFTVKRGETGDGLVDVGYINSTGKDLGTVTIPGDLGKITAGNDNADKPGVKALNVHSIGARGLDTQQAGGTLTSVIAGGLGSLTTKSDFAGTLHINGITGDASTGKIGKITIGGSIVGGSAANSGQILSASDIGTVVIKGSILGGSGQASGQLNSGEGIKSVTIGGSLEGSSGGVPAGIFDDIQKGSGSIIVGRAFSGELEKLTIVGDIRGGSGVGSGSVIADSESSLGAVTVKGSVVGGSEDYSGMIYAGEALEKLTVSGSIIGQGGDFNVGEDAFGQVWVSGRIGPVVVKGDLVGAEGTAGGRIYSGSNIASVSIGGAIVGGPGTASGSIDSGGSIGAVTVKRNLDRAAASDSSFFGIVADDGIKSVKIGGFVASAAIASGEQLGAVSIGGYVSSGLISGVGQENADRKDIAIKSIKVGGLVRNSLIRAGFDHRETFAMPWENADGQIGAVSVGGDWIASSISAGINPNTGFFGDGDDILAPDDDQDIPSRIASITIGGAVVGTPDAVSSTDSFAFVAQSIGSLKINGGKIKLQTDLDNLALSLITDDMRLKEFPI